MFGYPILQVPLYCDIAALGYDQTCAVCIRLSPKQCKERIRPTTTHTYRRVDGTLPAALAPPNAFVTHRFLYTPETSYTVHWMLSLHLNKTVNLTEKYKRPPSVALHLRKTDRVVFTLQAQMHLTLLTCRTIIHTRRNSRIQFSGTDINSQNKSISQ